MIMCYLLVKVVFCFVFCIYSWCPRQLFLGWDDKAYSIILYYIILMFNMFNMYAKKEEVTTHVVML